MTGEWASRCVLRVAVPGWGEFGVAIRQTSRRNTPWPGLPSGVAFGTCQSQSPSEAGTIECIDYRTTQGEAACASSSHRRCLTVERICCVYMAHYCIAFTHTTTTAAAQPPPLVPVQRPPCSWTQHAITPPACPTPPFPPFSISGRARGQHEASLLTHQLQANRPPTHSSPGRLLQSCLGERGWGLCWFWILDSGVRPWDAGKATLCARPSCLASPRQKRLSAKIKGIVDAPSGVEASRSKGPPSRLPSARTSGMRLPEQPAR